MSSEFSAETIEPASRVGFGRTLLITVLVLTIAAVGLTALNVTRGPSLRLGELDVAAAVEQPGRPLLLESTRPLRPVRSEDITITPAAPFTVVHAANQVTIRFDGMLRYGTNYSVRADVQASTGAPGSLSFEFTTPAVQMYTLQRADPAASADIEDVIVRRPVGSNGESADETVYSAPRIQEFAVAEPVVAVATSGPDGVGEVSVAALQGADPPRTLAKQVTISQLRSSGPRGVFGFIATNAESDKDPHPARLLIFEPSTGKLVPVKGLGGKPLQVSGWDFVPGTNSIVAQAPDSALYLIDPLGSDPPRPLGAHTYLQGFIPGSATLVVEDQNKVTSIDLETGKTQQLAPIKLAKNMAPYGLLPLSDRAQLRLIGRFLDDSPTRFTIDVLDGGRSEVVYRPPDPTAWIQSLCLSPNGQLVAFATSPPSAKADDDTGLPGQFPSSIVTVDIASKKVIDTFPGFLSSWCH